MTIAVHEEARAWVDYHGLLTASFTIRPTDITADFHPFGIAFLGTTATRLINEVKGLSRVVYDVTSKPPVTIEWE